MKIELVCVCGAQRKRNGYYFYFSMARTGKVEGGAEEQTRRTRKRFFAEGFDVIYMIDRRR